MCVNIFWFLHSCVTVKLIVWGVCGQKIFEDVVLDFSGIMSHIFHHFLTFSKSNSSSISREMVVGQTDRQTDRPQIDR